MTQRERSLLRGVIEAAIRRPLLLLIALLLVLLLGVQGWQRMSVDLLPRLDLPLVKIITHLQGASPKDVELLLTRPIEGALQGLNGVQRLSSSSAQGISQVTLQFDNTVGVNDARQRVQAKLSQLNALLPAGVVPRLEQIGTTLQEVVGYTVTAPLDSVTLLNQIRQRWLPQLREVQGVAWVDLLGGDQRAYVVALKPQVLMGLKLTLSEVAAALRQSNQLDLVGFAEEGGREWLIHTDDRLRSLADLGKVVIHAVGLKRPLLLAEIAELRESVVPKHYTIHANGQPAVALLIRKQTGANGLQVVARLDQALARLQPLLPAGATLRKFYDQAEIVARARDEVVQDLALGSILVVLTLYFFLGGFLSTLVVAATIPITVLSTVAVMQMWGLSLNIVTMTALALVIGMVVDDAIIVAENIVRQRSDCSPEEAALRGGLGIAAANSSGTLTTLAAFLPLLLVSGMGALLMRPFGVTVSVALLVSLLLSLLLVPALFALPGVRQSEFAAQRMTRLVTLSRWFVQALNYRKTVLLGGVLLVLLAVGLSLRGRMAPLPPMDEGSILIEYILPPGTSLQESNRIGNRLEWLALQQPEVENVYRRTGSPAVGYQIEAAHRGEVMMKLKPLEQRQRSADEVLQGLRHLVDEFPSASFLFHHPTQEKMEESFSGLPAIFGVTLYGDDEQRLIELSSEVETILRRQEGLEEVINNSRIFTNQLTIRLRPAQLARYGLTPVEVREAIRAAGLGLQVNQVLQAQERIAVLLRWQGEPLRLPEEVGQLPILTATGGWLPLAKLATIESQAVAASIERLNGQRQITLLAEPEGDVIAIASAVQQQLDQLKLPAGYSARVSGQYPLLIEMALEFLLTALVAVGLIYLIMVLQFASWWQPLAILSAIPVTLAGGLILVNLSGHALDLSIGMGALTLIGIAINNGIVLVDFANQRLRSGCDVLQAWQEAIEVRLRPILMTAMTTIASLLPMALGIGGASELFQPFSLMVIGGLLSALLATLLLLPVLLRERG